MDSHIAESLVQDLMTASRYVDYVIKGITVETESQELVNQLTLLHVSLDDISNQITQKANQNKKELESGKRDEKALYSYMDV